MSIEKMEYRRSYFDVSTMQNGARITTVITNDGAIISKNIRQEVARQTPFKRQAVLWKNLRSYAMK